jgi:hypothetical protein
LGAYLGAGASAAVYAGGATLALVTVELEGRIIVISWLDGMIVWMLVVDELIVMLKQMRKVVSWMMWADLMTGICTHEDHPGRPVIVNDFSLRISSRIPVLKERFVVFEINNK